MTNEAAARIASGNLCSLDIIWYSSRTFYRAKTSVDGHTIWSIIYCKCLGKATLRHVNGALAAHGFALKNAAILNLGVEKIIVRVEKIALGSRAHNRLKIQCVILRITWTFLVKILGADS
jgi:hypothetical protein